jgi:hypothetical protein
MRSGNLVPENLIEEPLKYLRGISKPEEHIRKFEKSEGGDDGCLGNVVRMKWNLVVSFYQIDCGEDFPARKLLCEVGNVPNGILFGDSPSIQSTIVTTEPPVVFFLGDFVEGRIPGAIGKQGHAVANHLLELRFGNSEAIRC